MPSSRFARGLAVPSPGELIFKIRTKTIDKKNGGTSTVADTLYVGYHSGSYGTYRLSGSGTLSLTNPNGQLRVGTDDGTGRFEWFADGLTTPTLTLGSSGTLAMGFDFDVAALGSGALSHGSAPSGLPWATLEVTNGATATQASSILVQAYLTVGSSTGSGTYDLSGGALGARYEYIGNSGTGVFTQSGGTNATGTVILGQGDCASGVYNIRGGVFSLRRGDTLFVGLSGSGVFNAGDANGTGIINESGSGPDVNMTVRNSSRASGTFQRRFPQGEIR